MTILAMDFDGVLCDSVDETGITGWKAGGTIWSDMAAAQPPTEILEGFRRARPVMETGHEAILLMRLLADGEDPDRLLADFSEPALGVLDRTELDVPALRTLFGSTRDRWRSSAPDEWAAATPFYAGVTAWLKAVTREGRCYVLTTKEERFVEHLFGANGVDFPRERVFGLDRGRPKEATLRDLAERHSGERVSFVEDRLATLKRCREQPGLESVALQLAGWGYNTAAEREEARRLSIPVLALGDLLRL